MPSDFKLEGEWRPSQKIERPAPKIVQLVIKYSGGRIKNEQQANVVLLLFSIVVIAIALYVAFGWQVTETPPPFPSAAEFIPRP